MEKLILGRSDLQTVPESFILPPETRPGNAQVSVLEDIPIIDFQQLDTNRPQLIKEIIDAAQEFGFFQLINHRVPESLLHNILDVVNEFFELPPKDKASFCSEEKGKVHNWREKLKHPCHPLDEHLQAWPQKPAKYREVVGSYSVEVRKLSLCLLNLICEGLELESEFFDGELSQVQIIGINYYPPCPDPTLTLGLLKHCDGNLITVLLQEQVHGLQVFKDEQWLAVEPVPNAFIVNIGHTLQIISNGKLSSAEHRVVTHKKVSRMSVASFIHPSGNCHIEPAKLLLVKDCSTPLYREFIYKDFLSTYISDTLDGLPPLDRYKLQP